jgi:flagellar biosynthesis anti-sigma factor FlgM
MLFPVEGVATSNSTRRSSAGRLVASRAESLVASEPRPGTDSVDVAQTAALIATIEEAAGSVPTVDPGRVADMRQIIASGAINADPQRIALSIVQFEALLS